MENRLGQRCDTHIGTTIVFHTYIHILSFYLERYKMRDRCYCCLGRKMHAFFMFVCGLHTLRSSNKALTHSMYEGKGQNQCGVHTLTPSCPIISSCIPFSVAHQWPWDIFPQVGGGGGWGGGGWGGFVLFACTCKLNVCHVL